MEYENKLELEQYFKDEINRCAKAEEEAILEEVKEIRAKALEETEKEAQRNAQLVLDQEKSEIASDMAIEKSRVSVDTTRRLIAKREAYAQAVFKAVKAKLIAFTEGNEYADYLQKKAAQLASKMRTEDGIFYVREVDLKFGDALKKGYGLKCAVKASDDIEIGGFRFAQTAKGIEVDETFDSALNDQREWFFDHSGMIIS